MKEELGRVEIASPRKKRHAEAVDKVTASLKKNMYKQPNSK
jgi:hypothetical protein